MFCISYPLGDFGKGYVRNSDGSTRLFDTLEDAKEFIKCKPYLTIEHCLDKAKC